MKLEVKTLQIESSKKSEIKTETIYIDKVSDCIRITENGKVIDIKIEDIKNIIGE